MPEGVVQQARALAHAEATVSLDYPCVRKVWCGEVWRGAFQPIPHTTSGAATTPHPTPQQSGDMYLTERLEMFRHLKLHSKDVTPPVRASRHLGRAARRRVRTVPGLDTTAKARERYNAARRNDYAHQLTNLTQSIGDSLMR